MFVSITTASPTSSVRDYDDEDWLAEWTAEDRAARLADDLESQSALEGTSDDAQRVEFERGYSAGPTNTGESANAIALTPRTQA
jgi:hypothetical protein